MKIARKKLRQIIKEEVKRTLSENVGSCGVVTIDEKDGVRTARVGSRVSGEVVGIYRNVGEKVRPYDFVILVGDRSTEGEIGSVGEFIDMLGTPEGQYFPGMIDMCELSGEITAIYPQIGDMVMQGDVLFTVRLS